MQLILIILAILIVVYVVRRLRSAFHFDRQVAKDAVSSDAASVRNASGRVTYEVTNRTSTRLSRLATKLENYAAEK